MIPKVKSSMEITIELIFMRIKNGLPEMDKPFKAILSAHYYLNGMLCACVEYRQNVAVDLYAVANNRLNAL